MLFLVYTFLIPLVCVLLMKYVPVCGNGIVNLILFGIEGASPTIAVVLVMLQKGGRKGLMDFLREKYRGIPIKYCVIGFGTPAIVLTIAKILTYATPYHNQFVTIPNAKKMLILLWALIAEELGWRGYLQEKLEKRFGSAITPLLLGFIWTSWHYHFWISGSMETPLLLFAYGCITESYGYYVITKLSGGNVVPASLWHFSGNLFFNLYLLNPNWNQGSAVPYFFVNALCSIYIVVYVWYRKAKGENYDYNQKI